MRENRANYAMGEILVNGFSLLYTKLFWPGARLIRFPARIRGKKAISFGKGFTTGYGCRIEINGDTETIKLDIGENCVIGDYAHIVANHSVTVGANVLMASRVFITDSSHGAYSESESSSPSQAPNEREMQYSPVVIGDNVWLGENVSILPGVRIGDGCVIGTSSVVTKDVPANCIAAGNPAKIIKRFNSATGKWERTHTES